MRSIILFLSVILTVGCATSQNLEIRSGEDRKVAVSTENLTIHSGTPVFSESTIQNVLATAFVDSVGNEVLEKVLSGYKAFTRNYEYTARADKASININVDHIVVQRRYLTLNIPHPGPIYKVTAYVNVYDGDSLMQSLRYHARANMAQVNFSDEATHWLSREEKQRSNYQVKTFNRALRDIYQQIYFNLFDIRI